jgi:hypothetical protein
VVEADGVDEAAVVGVVVERLLGFEGVECDYFAAGHQVTHIQFKS